MAIKVRNKIISDWFTPHSQYVENPDYDKEVEGSEKLIPPNDAARFLVQPMTQAEVFDVNRLGHMRELEDSEGVSRWVVHPNDNGLKVIFSKVTGWENVVKTKGGKDVPAKFSAKNFRTLIPWEVQQEIMQEIMQRSTVTDEEKKTS